MGAIFSVGEVDKVEVEEIPSSHLFLVPKCIPLLPHRHWYQHQKKKEEVGTGRRSETFTRYLSQGWRTRTRRTGEGNESVGCDSGGGGHVGEG